MAGFPGMSFAPPTQRAPDRIRRRTVMGGGHEAIPPAQHHQQNISGRDGGAAAVRADGLRAGALSARALRREVCAGAARKPGDHRGRAFQSVPPPSRGQGLPPGVPARPADSRLRSPPGRLPAVEPVPPGLDVRRRPDRRARSQRRGSARRKPQSRRVHGPPGRPLHSRVLGRAAASAVALAACPASGWEADVQRSLGSNASPHHGRADQPRGSEPRDAARPARPVRDLGGHAGRWHDRLARRRVAAPHGIRGRARGEGREARHGLGVRAGRASSCRARRKRRCRHALPLRVPGSPGDAGTGGHPRSGVGAGAPRPGRRRPDPQAGHGRGERGAARPRDSRARRAEHRGGQR